MRTLALSVLAIAALAAACGGSPAATFSAGDLPEVQEALALRGMTVLNAVSGDAGCSDSPLHSNVVRLDLTLAGEEAKRQMYLFRWRRPAQFETGEAAFAACVADSGVGAGDAELDTIEVPPWRAYGAAWSDDFRETVASALRAVAGEPGH